MRARNQTNYILAYFYKGKKKEKRCTYNVTRTRVRITTAAVEKQ